MKLKDVQGLAHLLALPRRANKDDQVVELIDFLMKPREMPPPSPKKKEKKPAKEEKPAKEKKAAKEKKPKKAAASKQ